MGERKMPSDAWIDSDEAGFDRAVGFFDATFALALTLLVTTIQVEDREEAFSSVGALWDSLGDQLISFGIAFAVISNYWLVHHRLFRRFSRLDYRTIVANLFLMAAIVLLPFCTESVGDLEADLPLPVVVMALDIVAVSGLSTVVFWLAVRRGLFAEKPDRVGVITHSVAGLLPAIVFAASIPIAYLVSPQAAALSWLSLLVLAPLAPRLVTRTA
ncbi:MAG TPA: TMEM175 family protein [Actinomycetota bacterium]|nr:TMEM175 family protein [Actinomycetota bacterium]